MMLLRCLSVCGVAITLSQPSPEASPAGVVGNVLQITNATGSALAFLKTGKGINSDPYLAPGGTILVAPDAVKRCVFSDGKRMWRYDLGAESIDFKKFQKFGFQRDNLDPYLYYLEIRSDRKLHVARVSEVVGAESRAAAPTGFSFPGFPLDPVDAGSPVVPVEAPRLRFFLEVGDRDMPSYVLFPSGRTVRDNFNEATELKLPTGTVDRLASEMERCGICDLEKRVPKVSGSGKRMTVEIQPESRRCNAALLWEDWSHNASAKQCLDAIHSALKPLEKKCPACVFP